jgi:LysR family transcriptional activator of nhaA
MTAINYNHLHYFWVVAREGSVVRASEELLVSQPTISSQIKDLENALGQKLFSRAGRGLTLTDAGRIAFNYANEMFSLGQELINALDHEHGSPMLKIAVGILDVIPKPIVRRLLEPATKLPMPVRLVCREDKADRLLADLAARRTDVVLSDSPIGTAVAMQGFNHLLGECDVAFLAERKLAARLKRKPGGFPKNLNGAAFLLSTDHTAMRRALNLWFDRKRIVPVVVGEFDDSATMYSFGQEGAGVFPVPSLVAAQIQREFDVSQIGVTSEVQERFYAITIEQRLKHSAVVAVCEAAKRELAKS